MAIFKGLYRGRGIYWHGKGLGYGDETTAHFPTIAAMRAAIDAADARREADRSPADRYWGTLSHAERMRWRRLCQTTELTAAELAYTNR